MTNYSLAETRRQLLALPDDLEYVLASLPSRVSRPMGLRRVVLCGSGDSYAAARIVATTARRTGMDISVAHPWQLISAATPVTAGTSVVLISASGTSGSIVAAADSQRGGPAMTVAVTGAPESPLARAAAAALVWSLSPVPCGPSPAVRTFAATYLAFAWLLGQLPDDASSPRGGLWVPTSRTVSHWPRSWSGGLRCRPLLCGTGRHIGAAEFCARR